MRTTLGLEVARRESFKWPGGTAKTRGVSQSNSKVLNRKRNDAGVRILAVCVRAREGNVVVVVFVAVAQRHTDERALIPT